jgi:hypothetical protein
MHRRITRRGSRRGTRRRKQRGGNEIESKITKIIQDVQKDRLPRSFQLQFTFKGVSYSTRFSLNFVELSKTAYAIEFANDCIEFNIEFYKSGNKLHSYLSRNSGKIACFSPRLVTTIAPVPYTSVDVLQTLATKFRILFQKMHIIDKIEIFDYSAIDYLVYMLPYRILRGLPALYEKYGYVSEALNTFRTSVLPTLTWNTLANTSSYEKIVEEYNKDKFEDDWKTHSIPELLTNVPFEIEKYNQISKTILENYISGDYYASDIMKFTLDVSSPKWKEWDAVLEFVGFEEGNGGKN